MTKVARDDGDPAELGTLSFQGLDAQRRAVLDAVGDDRVRRGPTTAARDLYRGVMLDAAMDGLTPAAERRADDRVVYVSALWGALRPADRVPDYRLHMCDRPDGPGHLVQFWQQPLAGVLPVARRRRSHRRLPRIRVPARVAADRRSRASAGSSIKPVKDATFERGAGGSATRAVRGEVLRRILLDDSEPRTPEQLADALTGHFAGAAAAAIRRRTGRSSSESYAWRRERVPQHHRGDRRPGAAGPAVGRCRSSCGPRRRSPPCRRASRGTSCGS